MAKPNRLLPLPYDIQGEGINKGRETSYGAPLMPSEREPLTPTIACARNDACIQQGARLNNKAA